jgi:uncharacterized protein (DUF169 family)
MNSRLVEALRLASSPVAVILTDTRPPGALQFKEGGWGCVASMMVAVSKGRTAVFDRTTFGCPGGGTGLGFGDQYEQCGFAIDCLLSTGSREAAGRLRRRSRMAEGERFFKSPEQVRAWLGTIPFTDVPCTYVVLKPLAQTSHDDQPALVVFLVNPDQLSALVVMADYERGTGDGVVARFGGACQSILFGYAEARRDRPRGVIGFFDIAQRMHVGRDVLSFTVPYPLFLEMEANVEGSFLELDDWRQLQARQGHA